MNDHILPPTLSTQLGRFVSETRFETLPAAVAQAVKLRLLDVLAASCTGVRAGNQHGLLELLPGDGPIGIWGTPATRSLRDAALINSAVAHSTYFEDGSRYTGGHPSSAVIPAAMALAQARGASGASLIAAIAVGYEVFLRLGRAIYPSTVRRGFQSTAILAAPATAAAAAVLLALSPIRAAHAIAIACSQGAGLKEALKSADSQPLQVGRSSEGGLLAALFAAQGATGSPDILELGFLKAFAQDADFSSITPELGRRWHIEETYLKAHGGCRGNHAPVDTAAALIARYGLTPAQIASIDVKVDTVTMAASIEQPLNGDQAQFSIGFSIAAMLIEGDATPMRFTDAALANPAIHDLMLRTRIQADAALDEGYPERRPSMVTIVTSDGRTVHGALDHARGEPENPMTRQDIERKFEIAAAPLFGVATAHIRELVLSLESLASLEPLGALLVPAAAGTTPTVTGERAA
jgi:2-methylcitrate dehydratase PrpD